MVIHTLEINGAATAINVSVEVDAGNTVNKVTAWSKDTYKGATAGIDLTSLLEGIDTTEDFVISNIDLGVDYISGLYAIEFYSSEVATPESSAEGIVANLLPYHECVLEQALAVVVKNCKIQKSKCGKSETLLFASTLLDILYDTIIFGLIDESVQILKNLDELCDICSDCPNYSATLTQTGYGYKTVSNIITLT